jgi:DNA-directed DNA polymerase III PolC
MFPLRVRSYYSLLQGTSSPAALCRRAKHHGYTGLALTDRDNLYGLWTFLEGCKSEGLQPVIGAEITEPGSKKSITCLVREREGYSNLCLLLTKRHQEQNFTLAAALPEYSKGLIVLCRDRDLLLTYQQEGMEIAADLGGYPTETGRLLRNWSRTYGITSVITPDSDMEEEGDFQLSCLLKAVRDGLTIGEVQKKKMRGKTDWLAGPGEYGDRFAVWPELVTATEGVAALCTYRGPDFGVVMPPWRGGDDKDDKPAGSVLRQKAFIGAGNRYGDDLGEQVVERLEHELAVIEQMRFSSYFLVVLDIVHRKGEDGRRRKRRICGRGSGAASLVAYCLEITNVCPMKNNLYFERFLNPGRTDPPDIDIDFPWDERDEVLLEVLNDFKDHAAMVCNHVFFKGRMAIRETAKAFGLPGYEISQVTKRLPWMYDKDGEESLEQRISSLASFRGRDLAPPWSEVLALAERLIGLPRYLSVHPGGVVITPEPISSYVPVELAAKGVPIIQWEKDGAEEAGLVKIDILGNRSLGVIRDCLHSAAENENVPDEINWQPEDDVATRLMVARGETMGCFYIESPAMRLLQQKAASGNFEELVIQSSIIRPAANEFVREYVRRLHGGSWHPLCPEMRDVLDETYGLMVYQEDVSRVAVALAGFSHCQADGLRKVMSKKEKKLRLENYRDRFFTGCAARGNELSDIERMWRMMMSFDGYSFCKAHSASYARVSYQAAYLKSHFPAEFMAAVISNQGGYYSTFAYVSEAKRLGLKICHPDVQQSGIQWIGKEKRVQVGLQGVRGLSQNFMDRIIVEREKGLFSGSIDFFARTKPADGEACALIYAGALDNLSETQNRSALLWEWASYRRARKDASHLSLFGVTLPEPPSLSPPDLRTRSRREFGVLGFLCNMHPLQFFVHRGERMVKACDLANHKGRRVELAAWLLTGKTVSTRSSEIMEFLTFEDETALFETTFFPEVYTRYANILTCGRPYVLAGLVEEDYGALTLTVDRVRLMMRK